MIKLTIKPSMSFRPAPALGDLTIGTRQDAQAAQSKAQADVFDRVRAGNADMSAQLAAALPGVDINGVSDAVMTGKTLTSQMQASLTNLSDRNFAGALSQLGQLADQYKGEAADASDALGALVSSASDGAQAFGIVAAATSKALALLHTAEVLADDPSIGNIIAFQDDLANIAANVGTSLTGMPITSAMKIFDNTIAELRKVSPVLADAVKGTVLTLALGPAGLIAGSAVADWNTQPKLLTIGEVAGAILLMASPIGWAAAAGLGGRALFCSLFSHDHCGADEERIRQQAAEDLDFMYTLQFNLMVSAVPALQCFAAVYPEDPNVKNTSRYPVPFHMDNDPGQPTTRYDPDCTMGTGDLPARCANLMVYTGGMGAGPGSILEKVNRIGNEDWATMEEDLKDLVFRVSRQTGFKYGMTTNQKWGLTYGMGPGYVMGDRKIPLFNMDGSGGLPGYYSMMLQWYKGQMIRYSANTGVYTNPNDEDSRNQNWRGVADWLISARRGEIVAQAAKKAAAIVLQRNLNEKLTMVNAARAAVKAAAAKADFAAKQAATEKAAKTTSMTKAAIIGGTAIGAFLIMRGRK